MMRGIVLLLTLCWCGWAQTADRSMKFEVVSVKRTEAEQTAVMGMKKSASGFGRASASPIRFSRRKATLAALLQAAYEVKPQQVIGPDWFNTERYDIEALAPEGATAAQQ